MNWVDKIKYMEKHIEYLEKEIEGMWEDKKRLIRERQRLLVLATKHCPMDHHDWNEILRFEV